MKRNKFLLSYRWALFFGLAFFSEVVAQRNHFVYLQTDDQLPFYVVHKGRNYSSSGIGYLILPKLADSTFSIKLGFPGAKDVENFDLALKGEDQGFLVKKFTDKGWGLFNLKTMEVQISGVELSKRNNALAAQKAASEQRMADSISTITLANEQKRITDSLEAAFVVAQNIRKADSLTQQLAKQVQKTIEDSIALAAAANVEKNKDLQAAASKKEALEKTAKDQLAKQKAESLALSTNNIQKEDINTKSTSSAMPDIGSPTLPELHQPKPAADATKKGVKELVDKKEENAARKLNEIILDSGYVGTYKDGADTIRAFIPTHSKGNEADAESDTISIRIPAKNIAKKPEIIAPSESKVSEKGLIEKAKEEKPKNISKPHDERFLDMEIISDSSVFVHAPK